MNRLSAFNFRDWIERHRDELKPPVGNRLVWEEADMTVMVVGGPNRRTDYHDGPVEEFFYQLEGDMLLKLFDNGEFYDVVIREGDVFLLPPHVRHSVQRPVAGSVGLVIEPTRPQGEKDAFEWYCFECGALLHRAEIQLASIVDDLPPLFARFYDDDAARSCDRCGALHPGREAPDGWSSIPAATTH